MSFVNFYFQNGSRPKEIKFDDNEWFVDDCTAIFIIWKYIGSSASFFVINYYFLK